MVQRTDNGGSTPSTGSELAVRFDPYYNRGMPYKNKEDQRAASRKHYVANKEKINKRSAASRQAMRDHVNKLKESSPCTDCGQDYPYYVMQYDHINSDKVAGVATLLRTSTLAKALEEIAKCELVCANCHAIRTWTRHGIDIPTTT